MKMHMPGLTLALLCTSVLLFGSGPAVSQAPPPPTGSTAADTEPLASGPLHEAYAQPVDYQPQPGPVVTKQPPEAIDEVPPDQKPEGNDVRWVPGYWAWDSDKSDFLWVSGFWRDMPPSHSWVPGSWQEVEGGWQWSPGFWTTEDNQDVEYVSYPPPSVDNGPSTPAPNESDVYSPGCWVWRDGRFLWRPGFWVPYQPDWVWVPARYVWTPGGCVFVDGYWDHPFESRGVLFSPVRILRRDLSGFVYTPSYVVSPDYLLSALFIGPVRHHYYFGDYFTDTYTKRGFVPWFDYRPSKNSWDPLYNHYRVAYRGDRDWDHNLHELYRARFAGEAPRPPRTFADQEKLIRSLTDNKTGDGNVIKNARITKAQSVTGLTPIAKFREEKVSRLSGLAATPKVQPRVIKVQPVKKEEIDREKQQIQHVRQVAQQRRDHEAKLVQGGTVHLKPAPEPKGSRFTVPKSPVVRPAPTPRPPAARPPAAPQPPKHEERPVPKHEPPKPPQPPKRHK